jgi:hypothetical protein
MKLQDFGLWFQGLTSGKWSTIIPRKDSYKIFYDGHFLGIQWSDFELEIYNSYPYIIVLKNKFAYDLKEYYRVGRLLTLDDFEIMKNPNYRGSP